MFINLCVFRVADFSHFRDAEQDRGCSADVGSPPRASWGVMEEPALPSTRTVELVYVYSWGPPVVVKASGEFMWEWASGIPQTPLSRTAEAQG